ncbi:MAG: sigma-54-dependent Fis family transcriptional regulator [Alphaproteobacteria bacterium]|nr:sigma-54-dependent Fis family transcriptional regulator [Alphaproteobacteria bacterium]
MLKATRRIRENIKGKATFEAAAEAWMEALCGALTPEMVSLGKDFADALVLRGVLQLLGPRRPVVVHEVEGGPSEGLTTSATTRAWIEALRSPLIIDALLGEVFAPGGPPLPTTVPEGLTDATREILGQREATHVLAVPVFTADDELAGVLSIELAALSGVGLPLAAWTPLAELLDDLVQGTALHVLARPHAPDPGPLTEPGMPVVGALMAPILRDLRNYAAFSQPILLLGPTGVGKTRLARWFHQQSGRENQPFEAIQLQSVPTELVESELFGYRRGAFSGAWRDQAGAVQRAGAGTLFIDEVGCLSPPLQAKLLELLGEGLYRQLGDDGPKRRMEARVVLATNADLPEMVRTGRFRSDLYWRISGLTVELPSLAERADEIGGWAAFMLARLQRECGREGAPLSSESEALLARQPWPGNLRELENVLNRAWVDAMRQSAEGPVAVRPHHLRAALRLQTDVQAASGWVGALRVAVDAWVDEALRRQELGLPALSLDDARVFQAAILEEAERRLDAEEAFRALGEARMVKNRNYPRVREKLRQVTEAFEAKEGSIRQS